MINYFMSSNFELEHPSTHKLTMLNFQTVDNAHIIMIVTNKLLQIFQS